MLSVKELTKIYKTQKNQPVVALDHVSIDFADKGLVFLLGKSGSGKSTLLNSIGGLDTFDSGEIIIKGRSSKTFSQSDFDSYRNTFIGFIFQDYNILEEFSVAKNLALALELQGKKADKESVDNLLRQVEMLDYADRKPNQLSGGQKQRVAIARALIKNPEIIMADEPTGALDSNTGKQVMDTLKQLSKTKLVIIVSHDREFAELYGDRIIELKDGKIIRDVTKKEIPSQETSSGLKIIDGKMLYIKKGQRLSSAELNKISNLLEKNSQYVDTFISFDDGANTKLKENANINASGNKESFVSTQKEDVKLKEYDGGKLKLIKSRLKNKDAFKMGASSLNHKKGKLFFTILLSFVAFALFGLVDTFACFDKAKSMAESIRLMGDLRTSISFEKLFQYEEDYSQNEAIFITKSVLDKEQSQIGIDVVGVKAINNDWSRRELELVSTLENNSQVGWWWETSVSGVVSVSQLEKLNMKLLSGALPTNDNQIVITKYMFDSIKNTYKGINDYNDILGESVKILIGGESIVCEICGIANDSFDVSKYETVSGNDFSSYLKQQEFNTLVNYGVQNLVFGTDNCVLSYDIYPNLKFDNVYSTKAINYRSFDKYISTLKTQNKYSATDNSRIYMKSGNAINTLKKDDIVLSLSLYNSINTTNDSFDQVCQLIEEGGVRVNLKDHTDKNVIKTFNLVGLINDNMQYDNNDWTDYCKNLAVVNGEGMPMECGNYDFAIVVHGGENVSKMTKAIYDMDISGIKCLIQNASTDKMEDFGYTISGLAQIFLYVSIGFAVFSAFLLMNFISTSISYKKREIGILRAIGARGSDVYKIFFYESLLISFINFVLAVVGAFVACYLINRKMVVDLGINLTLLVFGVRQLVLMTAISFVVSMIATFLPVYKIAKKNPIDAINNR